MFNMTSGLLCAVQRVCLSAAALVCLSTQIAHADIAAYNAAVAASDFETAVSEATDIWSSWDQSDPQTIVIIQEFTLTATKAGDAKAIRDFATDWSRLNQQGENDGLVAVVSSLTIKFSDFAEKPKKSTAEPFIEALNARLAEGGVDSQSILIASKAYNLALQKKLYKQAVPITDGVAELWGRAGPQFFAKKWRAQNEAIGVKFLQSHNKKTYYAIEDLIKANVTEWEKYGEAVPFDEARREFYNSQAWAYAMEAYFQSQHIHLREWDSPKLPRTKKLKSKDSDESSKSKMPFCENGKFPSKKLPKYPNGQGFMLPVGALILKLSTDETGQVDNAEVLGVVPANKGFEEATIKAVKKWKWKVDKGVDVSTCRLNRTNIIAPFQFVVH